MLEDGQIIDLFYARDEGAITALADKYGSTCRRIATNILKNELDAEECVSDAYLALWNSIPPERPQPLKAYLLRVLRNLSVAKYHANTAAKRNSHYDVALDELAESLADLMTVDRELEAREASKTINRFLGSLDRDSRVMFLLRYWCSESVSDIAEKFEMKPHAVSARLFRIRERFKKYLMKEGIGV